MIPLQKNKIVKNSDLTGIFGNIKEIMTIHQKFLKKLQRRLEETKLVVLKLYQPKKKEDGGVSPETDGDVNKTVGRIRADSLKKVIESQEFDDFAFQYLVFGDIFEEVATELKVYSYYCNNYNLSARITEDLKLMDSKYTQFVSNWFKLYFF